MVYTGVLTKMKTEFLDPIQYYLEFASDFIHVNQLLGKNLSMTLIGQQCLSCGFNKDIYRQGFCKSCFFDMPMAGAWIMRPELSTAHLDKEDRDLDYEKKVQLQPHVVYLANSSGVKVGVTRKNQIPTRWIDQGAHEAIEIIEVPNRYLAGITEVALKDHVADKTNWRKMLKNDNADEDLKDWRERLKHYIPEEALMYYIENNEETHLHFPVSKYPEKPKSLNLKKEVNYSGKLVGIKGQYLIFEDETVFNIRSNEGLVVAINV